MAIMNVTLPDPMREWVDAQTRNGRYATAGDYVRDLIRCDQEKAFALAELEQALDEGFDSGVSDRPIQDVFDEARAQARTLRSA